MPKSNVYSPPASGMDPDVIPLMKSKEPNADKPASNKLPVMKFEDYLLLVEENHPSLRIAGINQQISRAKRIEKQGAFDPAINSKTTFNRFNSTSDIGADQEAFETVSALEFVTRQGTKVSLGYMLSDGDIKTPVKPTGDGGEPYFKLAVPLIRGAFVNPKSTEEKQAFLLEDQAAYKVYLKRLEVLLKATSAYWKWVSAERALAVEEQLLELANVRLTMVERRAKEGDLAAIDVVEAGQEVQKRQGRLARAQRNLQEATLILALYLWDANGDPLPTVKVQQSPGLASVDEKPEHTILKASKIDALQFRPELSILDLSRSITKLDKKLAFNQLLPQLDAILEPGYELGANGIDNTYRIGAQVSIPLRRRTARGRLDQAKLTLERLSVQERQLIRSIFVQVEDVYSQLITLYDRIQAATQEVELAETMAHGERTRYSLGDSTLFVVNRRERSAAQARIKLIKLKADYAVAEMALKAASGRL
ncbi:MAG: TolC family protein [Vampirovibrionales bacterium]